MFNIAVERVINKPIKTVFAVLSDHANYAQFKGVDASTLLQTGEYEVNGQGALREIVAGKSVLHERIVGFKPPRYMAYKIEYSKPLPYDHELGQLTLTEITSGTHVRWESKGHINIPLIGGWYFDKQIEKFGARAFGSILKHIDMQ
uniref:SRPBCC family protein n=1 Tax=Ningiella ruwaisensis TaxID=2364274 RepID=UPI00109FA9F6|nr:SRPBCC family protein [Ningiella ruwaisensis]